MLRPLLALSLVAAAGPTVLAFDAPPAKSYTAPTADGRFTFVMLTPAFSPDHPTADELKLRWKYPRSGLYETTGGRPKLKWAVDWYAETARPSADGIHLARVHTVRGHILPGKTRTDKLAEVRKLDALSLYANGKLVKAYSVGDLFDASGFTDDQLGTWFSWGGEAKLDDAAGTVTVRAATGEWATVSLRTREVVDRGRRSDSLADAGADRARHPWWAVLAAGVGVVGIGGAVLFLTAALLVRRVEPRTDKMTV